MSDLEVLDRCMYFGAKQMPPSCLSRWCEIFLFLDLLKNIYQNQSYDFAKFERSEILWVLDLRLDMWLDPDWICNWVCEEIQSQIHSQIQSQIRYPKNHSSRTLQSRNFGSNKSFLANPKIKIIGIIEINTLVAIVLRSYQPQYEISEIPQFFRVLAEALTWGLGQYSES